MNTTVSRALLIAGEPASGKTTLMQAIIRKLEKRLNWPYSDWHTLHPGKLLLGYAPPAQSTFRRTWPIVLGAYPPHCPEGAFNGSDRLSMAVQPELLRYASLPLLEPSQQATLYGEGDRVTNLSLLEGLQAQGIDVQLWLLRVAPEEQHRRFRERGTAQDPTFLKAKRTKSENLLQALSSGKVNGYELWLRSPEDTEKAAEEALFGVYWH